MFYAFLTLLVALCIAAIAAGYAFGCRMPEREE